MTVERHGLSIGIERVDDKVFLALKAIGKLTHEDYQVITPMLDSALQGISAKHVNVLIDGTEMRGWEARAAWDDFRLGLRHGSAFGKIAIYGKRNWLEIVAKIGSWFISGEVKYFPDQADAIAWLTAD